VITGLILNMAGHDAGVEHVGLDGVHDDDHDDGPQGMARPGGVDGHEHDGRRGDERAEHRMRPQKKTTVESSTMGLMPRRKHPESGQGRVDRGDHHLGPKSPCRHTMANRTTLRAVTS